MANRPIIAAAAFAVLVLGIAFSQERGNNSGEQIKLIYADSLSGYIENGLEIRECIGNVHLRQGEVDLKSDRAIQYINQNRAVFTGNVKVTQKGALLEAPLLTYYGATGIALGYGGIKITDAEGVLTADSGSYSTKSQIVDFKGHVKLLSDSAVIYGDTVQYHRKTRISYAYGNVKIDDDSVFIYCDTAERHKDTRMNYAYGNVRIEDDSVLIFSDRIVHNRNVRESFAYGNVLIKGRYKNINLFTDTLINKGEEGYTFASGNPLLIKIDTAFKENNSFLRGPDEDSLPPQLPEKEIAGYDTLRISSDTMEVFRDGGETYFFKKNVKLLREGVSAKSDNALYKKALEKITMLGVPVIWFDSTQLHGDTLMISLPENKLSEIESINNALAATKDDLTNPDRINQISGDAILISVSEDTIRKISAYNNTKTVYFMFSEGKGDGAIRQASDTLIISFEEGELANLAGMGGIEGERYSEGAVAGGPESYYLPSFTWAEEKPGPGDFRKAMAGRAGVNSNFLAYYDSGKKELKVEILGHAEEEFQVIIRNSSGKALMDSKLITGELGKATDLYDLSALAPGEYEVLFLKNGVEVFTSLFKVFDEDTELEDGARKRKLD